MYVRVQCATVRGWRRPNTKIKQRYYQLLLCSAIYEGTRKPRRQSMYIMRGGRPVWKKKKLRKRETKRKSDDDNLLF